MSVISKIMSKKQLITQWFFILPCNHFRQSMKFLDEVLQGFSKFFGKKMKLLLLKFVLKRQHKKQKYSLIFSNKL